MQAHISRLSQKEKDKWPILTLMVLENSMISGKYSTKNRQNKALDQPSAASKSSSSVLAKGKAPIKDLRAPKKTAPALHKEQGNASALDGYSSKMNQSETQNSSRDIQKGPRYKSECPQPGNASNVQCVDGYEPKGRVFNAIANALLFANCDRDSAAIKRGWDRDLVREAAIKRGWDPNKVWHFKPASEALSDLGLDVVYHSSQPDSWSKFPDKAIVGIREDGQTRAAFLWGDYLHEGDTSDFFHNCGGYKISDASSYIEIKPKRKT
jgi:hypothetical protein